MPQGELQLQPITLGEAKVFVTEHHRHHIAPQGALFAIALNDGQVVVAVVIVGLVARMLRDGFTAEVVRLCVLDGHRNACSQLYAAAWRAAKAMGYRRLVTYTLASEGGTSLHAAGWRAVARVPERSWNRPKRLRVDKHPTQAKVRWEAPDAQG